MTTTLTHNEMLAQPKIANLMRWIDSHGCAASTLFDVSTGELIVSSVATARDSFGAVYSSVIEDRIPATLAAARDLLGY